MEEAKIKLKGAYAVNVVRAGSPGAAGFGYDMKLGKWKTPFPSWAVRLLKDRKVTEEDKEAIRALQDYRKDRLELSYAKDGFFVECGILKPFQKAGVEYMLLGGNVLLADEMGLGKTVQVIGYLNELEKLNPNYKALIICPATLKINWKKEIYKFLKVKKTVRVVDAGSSFTQTPN